MKLDAEFLEQVVHGGAVLGGGGGGSISAGLKIGREALARGHPYLIDLSELPGDATLVTLSSVGASGSDRGGVAQRESRHVRALQLFQDLGMDVAGFIASEVGPGAVIYGWLESAQTGIPVVDAPCNGRAHPTGLMGSLDLHRRADYVTTTIAVGGTQDAGTGVELVVRGSVQLADQVVRTAAKGVDSSVAVVRNPVSATYAMDHAAVGGLMEAARIGDVLLTYLGRGLSSVLAALTDAVGGQVLAIGSVQSVALASRAGYRVGTIVVDDDAGRQLQIRVCNEYMMVLDEGMPVVAFPDLIVLFDCATALPLDSTDVHPGQQVGLFCVPRSRIKLGTPMDDPALLEPVEALLGLTFPHRPLRRHDSEA